MRLSILLISSALFLFSCSQQQKADWLIYNTTIYTVDSSFSKASAMAWNDGKIIAVGTLAEIERKYSAKNKLNARGGFIYPGFIDAHAHFAAYGLGLQEANLVGTTNWEEIIQLLEDFEKRLEKNQWLIGRGWDQNDWKQKDFPTNEELNKLFPDRPVLLTRIDGHAAVANQKAFDISGINPGLELTGGEVDVKEGRLTGILIDNAIDLVSNKIPLPSREQFNKALLAAQNNCFAVGLTTVDDCGINADDVERIKELQEKGDLKMRMYIMLSDSKSNFDYLEKKGIIKTDRLHVRSFKVYGDGALGSRGACLLQPYNDKPGHFGFLLSNREHFDSVAAWIFQKNFQMCTHAIGDSGNRTMLNIYSKYLNGPNDLRWRIEHAQVINENDFKLFGENSIIPSVQPTHATSDMYWAADRLGNERVTGAYAYKQLLKQNGWLPLGTDFPVEDISPFKTFYAAVVRKDEKGWPEGGYHTENALTRQEALRGMTIWAAKANFEEKEKGSLEPGKMADFVILDKDLMQAKDSELLQIKVLKTFSGGEKVYEKK
ncbi:MAG: amidohydrolase [Chitinophagaceae bacterium]